MFKLALSALALFAVLPWALGEVVFKMPDTVSTAAETIPANVVVSGVQQTGVWPCAGTSTPDWREFTPTMVTSAIQDAAARAIDRRLLGGYPHINRLGGVPNLPAACSASSAVIWEHPILINGLYAGGSPGRDRVFFIWSNTGTRPSATLCAVMTHVNAPPGGFTRCIWRLPRKIE